MPSSPEILPQPFEWSSIPSGTVRIEVGGRLKSIYGLLAFEITKYPITNAQFACFLNGSGYKNPSFWSKEGLDWKNRRQWEKPRYWDDVNFNAAEQPVVGVSWYEAEAFCAWLRNISQENVDLATEMEWQFAAQGQTRWRYPWGNEFDEQKCNNKNSGLAQSSSVLAYPNGASIFGVYDLCGNVWEWTSSRKYGRSFIMRGGSFLEYPHKERLQINNHTSAFPHVSSRNLGFRIVRRGNAESAQNTFSLF